MQHVIHATLKLLAFPVFNEIILQQLKQQQMSNASRCQYWQLNLMGNVSDDGEKNKNNLGATRRKRLNIFAVPTFTGNQIFVTQSDNIYSTVWPL